MYDFEKSLSSLDLTTSCRYDSVIVDGRVRWQDRLNSINLPFFLPSTAFFSNYAVRRVSNRAA